MGMKLITGNTPPEAEPNIYAEDDAAIYQSIVGSDGVFSIGQQLKATVLSNNKVRVADGVICVGGHFARTPYGEYTDCEIVNGQSGKNRNDIIVAKFVTTGSGGVDSLAVTVVQGAAGTTAVDPALTQNDIYQAGKIRELPLYRVKIQGLSIVAVEKLFTEIPTIPQLADELNSKLVEKEYTAESFGVSSVWQALEWNCTKKGKSVRLNAEIYTSAAIVANNLYTINTGTLDELRPKHVHAIAATACNGSFGDAIPVMSLITTDGDIKLNFPSTGKPYVFFQVEYETE